MGRRLRTFVVFVTFKKKEYICRNAKRVKKNKRRFWVIQSVNTNTNTNKSVCPKIIFLWHVSDAIERNQDKFKMI